MIRMSPHRMAQALGRRGGRARAARLSAAHKKKIAALGGHARRESIQAARRSAANLEYATAAAELRGSFGRVQRVNTCDGPLPGIYARRL
jgi:hypothetical protein